MVHGRSNSGEGPSTSFGEGCSGGSSSCSGSSCSGGSRRPCLLFPPPPPFPPDEYAYAYYEPSAKVLNKRHSYVTRYGTQENLYEEIRPSSRLEEEVRYVHTRHQQVLDELNLSVEAMLMPTSQMDDELANDEERKEDEELQESGIEVSDGGASCSTDFSGGTPSTNSYHRQQLPLPTAKKKSPHAFWKKLPGLSQSHATIKPSDEPRYNSGSWGECSLDNSQRSSCSDVEFSSGEEDNKSMEGKRVGSKRCVWRKNSPEPGGGVSQLGRFSRWFSMKKAPPPPEPIESVSESTRLRQLTEEEECSIPHRRLVSPCLPPVPIHLTPQQLKMRHIIEAIVQSENSYHSTLQRLVYEYKKPLEETCPPLLSTTKIQALFHRVPEILQCHTLFRIALAEAVVNWDREYRIGDVFVASFSKSVVLDIYSDFINNFSYAMDLVRSEGKKKPALVEFFKTRQVNSPDRLSIFALMVKPIQRFPQFILFLQDLLQNIGHGHPERMALQLALTQLESLAELLNERKRESEQAQAFRHMMRSISAKIPSSSHNNKYLIRHDDVTLLEMNQFGPIAKYKRRRLLMLNDQLVCVALNSKDEANNSQQRLSYKWSFPITDIQVIESNNASAISRLVASNSSLTSNSSGATESLATEMKQLMHDYEVIKRIHDLTQTLNGTYQELDPEATRALLVSIKDELKRKDDQMARFDSCSLQIYVQPKNEAYTFQMPNHEIRKEWITELRLARLALDSNNSPSWEVPEQELRPLTKMPLFVAAHPVYTAQPNSEVTCGCFYSAPSGKISYLWVCTSDGVDSNISIAQLMQTTLSPLTQLKLSNFKVNSMEYIRGLETVWMGTTNQRLLIYSVTEVDNPELVNVVTVPGNVVSVKQHCDNIFVSLTTGSVLLFRRHTPLTEPEEIVISTGEPVNCILPINLSLYAALGKTVTVVSAITGEMQKSFTIKHDHSSSTGSIGLMAHSGVGLWLSMLNSSTICLYHTETFKHLQDINIASNVLRMTGCPGQVKVTALMACKGLLWVGTDAGVALTVPLPRLEGVPIISGKVNVSYHAHSGPLTLLLPLHDPPTVLKRPASKALASDVYGLYGQLMYIKEYDEEECKADSDWTKQQNVPNRESIRGLRGMALSEPKKEHTLVTITGGKGYVNYQQCCYKNIADYSHIVLWEMKL